MTKLSFTVTSFLKVTPPPDSAMAINQAFDTWALEIQLRYKHRIPSLPQVIYLYYLVYLSPRCRPTVSQDIAAVYSAIRQETLVVCISVKNSKNTT